MAPESRSLIRHLLGVALMALVMASCSTVSVGPGGRISKVKYYHLVPGNPVRTVDPAVEFERDHHLFGAVTRTEVLQRTGHYYTIFWRADDRTQPVTVRFEYRQANTGLNAKVIEEEVADLRRTNVSKFQVTGDDYSTHGRVTAWKVTLLRGKEELASQQSYLWN